MRIWEVRVNRYGPLSGLVLTGLSNFTLVFGENESGKTLLIDAILRFLLTRKRERDLFARLDRVEHDPDGYIEIQEGDRVLRFPDQGSLPELLDISADDLRNVLIVRASDLQVHEDKPKEYYAEITDRLMGIHREPIGRILSKLQDIGQLTSTGKLASTKANKKLGSRVDDANDLLGKIEELQERSAEVDMVALEADLLDANEQQSHAANELDLLTGAKKREQFESGNQLLADVGNHTEQIAALPDIKQTHYDEWRDAQNALNDSGKELDEAKSTLEGMKKNFEDSQDEVAERVEELNSLSRKEPTIQQLDKLADRYRERLEAAAGWRGLKRLLPPAILGLGALLALSFVGLILDRALGVLEPASVLLGILLALSVATLIVIRIPEGRRASAWESLRLLAAELELQADNIEDLLAAVKQYEDDLDRARGKVSDAKGALGIAAKQLENEDERIKGFGETIKKVEQTLANLKQTTGVSTFEALQQTMNERKRLESDLQDLLTKLVERFGEADGSLEDKIPVWRTRVDELASFAEAAQGVEFNEDLVRELEERVDTLDAEIAEMDKALKGIRGEIDEFAAEANRILSPDDPFPGDTLEDLAVIEKKLRAFTEEVETRAHLAWSAMEIFDDIQAEEEQKVKGLFGEDDLASQYFRSITGGAYDGVSYEPSSGELNVVRSDGEQLRGYALSSGAYDQLYLATRLSLADRLLQGEPGFLLLDDAFLTSDSKRLPRQMNILLDLSQSGWQILYFSVKDEIRALLRDPIEKDQVDEISMDPLAVPAKP